MRASEEARLASRVTRTREQRERAAVITAAPESLPDQLRRRQVRYAAMMGLRLVCLLGAALVVAAEVPYAMVWVAVFVVGMVALPWMAVLIANDRPPKKDLFSSRLHSGHPDPARALPSRPEDSRVIDL